MNTYRIRYVTGARGLKVVHADSVNGFDQTTDTYVFKRENQVVAAVPKAVVLSVELVDEEGE